MTATATSLRAITKVQSTMLTANEQKLPNHDVTRIINAFESAMGYKLPQNKKMRQYSYHLVRQFGDKAHDLAMYAISIQGKKYAPTITNPQDLYYKSGKVLAFYNRQKTSNVIFLE